MLGCFRKCCACLPQRYVLVAMIVTGLIACYLMRACLQIALNEMTFKVQSAQAQGNTYCPPDPNAKSANQSRAEFHWTQEVQHQIITVGYVGYVIAHVPAGVLSDLFGGKQVFGAGIVLSAIASLLTPVLARASVYAFMAARFALGFGQGAMFPCASALVAKWAPPNERSTMTGFVQTGVMLGNAIAFFFSGLIMDSFPGWDPVFYFVGTIGLLWCIFWYTICYSSPAEHPFVSEKEREMIETQIALTSKKKPNKIPWCNIFMSLPFWSACMINFGHAWALFTMVNEMPLYTRKVLNYNIKSSAIMSALPHLAMIPTAVGIGYLGDYLIKKGITSITVNRKVFAFLSNTLPIPFLIGASYAGCDRDLVVGLLICMMFFKGLTYSTCRANPVDLSPNFAGVLMGFMNGTGAFAAIISPMMVPIFTEHTDGSIDQWRNYFFMSAGVMLVFSLPFLCFGSGEVQPWNDAKEEDNAEQPAVSPEERAK